MKLNADILYESLSRQMAIKRSGSDVKSLILGSPLFFYEDMTLQDGRVYVGRAGELPPPPKDVACLIICVGGGFPSGWTPGKSCVFIVVDETDILRIFNTLQATYEKYQQWSNELREILDGTASIEEMIRVTAPIFDNPIALCNNRLEIEAVADPGNSNVVAPPGPVPEKYVQQFLGRHNHNIAIHHPFVYEIDGNSTYCINIFKQDTYLGLVAMGDTNHSFRPGDFELFGCFFEYISAAAEKRLNTVGRQFITLKSVFRDLLASLPVSASLIHKALGNKRKDGGWICAAIKLTGDAEQLPVEYLCTLIESHLATSIALYSDGHIAAFLSVQGSEKDVEASCQALEMVLKDLSMQAGVSFAYTDILKSRYFFRQAVCALETAATFVSNSTLCHFSDYALFYALHNSMGEFPVEYMMPENLLSLRDRDDTSGGADYWRTLKIYLDNEMNSTQTAKELYIHRTTLQTRLNRLRKMIDLSTPRKRLYIRYCMYLYESFAANQ
ncbi:helix-turn-helix domain-containing protein [Clostridia bacterium OttesenSCG-928-O13]|nr:helix-turn-helix domain-containing protein [Clostridia bacterium OttesenSCG-928-O13]